MGPPPTSPPSAPEDLALAAYGLDYRPRPPEPPGPGSSAVAITDHGIRASDAYIAARDPLRGEVQAGDAVASVHLGVDPGGFFCGALFAELLALREDPSLAGVRVGFIHVPPDRSTGCPETTDETTGERVGQHLYPRPQNLAMIAEVVAIAARGLLPATTATGTGTVLLTGFGPFVGVADNPTAAALRAPGLLEGALSRSAGPGVVAHNLELRRAVIPLGEDDQAARAGRYRSPAAVLTDLHRLLPPAAPAPAVILGLGVDSGQLSGGRPPAFKIETQTWGWGAAGPHRRDLGLARVFLAARRPGARGFRGF